MVEASVRGDAIQPRPQRLAIEAVEGAPDRHQHLLKDVLGIVHRAERAIAVHEQLSTVGTDEFLERGTVTGSGAIEK